MKTVFVVCPRCKTPIDFSAAIAEWLSFTSEKNLSNEMSLSLWCDTCDDMTLMMEMYPTPFN
jgi:uncharacterized protein YbaR (Trm112 family)